MQHSVNDGKKDIVVASAQMSAERERLRANIDKHIHFIETASKHDVDLILFPEMSLTGYERELALDQAFYPDDERLSGIKKAVAERGLMVVAGAPLLLEGKLYIGLIILQPSGEVMLYTKQYLHPGEELFFSPGTEADPAISIGAEILSFAICYDIENSEHPRQAARRSSTLYAASIFYSHAGIAHGQEILQGYAREHSMSILMSNFCGKCWDMESGGGSVFFAPGGEKIAECSPDKEELLIASKFENNWAGECVSI